MDMVGQLSGEQYSDMFDKETRKHTECCKISIHKHIIGNICELSTEEKHKEETVMGLLEFIDLSQISSFKSRLGNIIFK